MVRTHNFSPPCTKLSFPLQIKIDCKLITEVKHIKFLGVLIDSKLSWKDHLNHICSKVAKGLGIIFRAKPFLPKHSLQCLYYSFIYPHISYCIHVWGSANQYLLQPLFKLQKRAVRCIDFAVYMAPSSPIFSKLKILQLSNIYKYEIILFMYKYKNNELPPIFSNWFIKSSDVHSYATRNSLDYQLPLYRTEFAKSFIKFKGAFLWNLLEQRLKIINIKLSSYKKLLKNCLMWSSFIFLDLYTICIRCLWYFLSLHYLITLMSNCLVCVYVHVLSCDVYSIFVSLSLI